MSFGLNQASYFPKHGRQLTDQQHQRDHDQSVGVNILIFVKVAAGISAFLQNVMTVPVVSKALKGIRVAVVLLILRAGINMLRNILKKTPDKNAALIFFGLFLTLTLCSLLLAWRIPTILMILVSGMLGYALFSRKGAAK